MRDLKKLGLAIAIALSLFLPMSQVQGNPKMQNVRLGLGQYGSQIIFPETISASRIVITPENIVLYNFKLASGAYTAPSQLLSTDNSNLTVESSEENRMEFSLSGLPTKTKTITKVSAGGRVPPKPKIVREDGDQLDEKGSLEELSASDNGWYFIENLVFVKTNASSSIEMLWAPIWHPIETWAGTINAPAVWQSIETWTGTITAQIIEIGWTAIETWTGTITAILGGTPLILEPWCEGRPNPLDVDDPSPEFSAVYAVVDNIGPNLARAFRIQVGTSQGDNSVWDHTISVTLHSGQRAELAYAGPKLRSESLYWWRARFKDTVDNWTDWTPLQVLGTDGGGTAALAMAAVVLALSAPFIILNRRRK